uniref:Oligomycin sensitivity conferral protein n=1 Tax=Hemiscolopendra marginata TaxID=943146 RepID=A0A646QIR3_9MYRI
MFGSVRKFSTTSAVAAKLAKTPLAVFGTEGRYATALYSAASKEKKLDAVEKELTFLQNALAKDKKFSDFILNPTLKKQLKKDALLAALRKQNATKLTENFCQILTDNGRLNKLSAIVNVFLRLMSAHRGDILCEITSAKALDEPTKNELTTALKGFLKSGENLKLELKVDPSIIGGLVVSIGDKHVDMSLATKIKTYTALLKEGI